ncbi:hypothetical protein HK096_003721, partial [Nowakowskiella sp. JEL0078]
MDPRNSTYKFLAFGLLSKERLPSTRELMFEFSYLPSNFPVAYFTKIRGVGSKMFIPNEQLEDLRKTNHFWFSLIKDSNPRNVHDNVKIARPYLVVPLKKNEDPFIAPEIDWALVKETSDAILNKFTLSEEVLKNLDDENIKDYLFFHNERWLRYSSQFSDAKTRTNFFIAPGELIPGLRRSSKLETIPTNMEPPTHGFRLPTFQYQSLRNLPLILNQLHRRLITLEFAWSYLTEDHLTPKLIQNLDYAFTSPHSSNKPTNYKELADIGNAFMKIHTAVHEYVNALYEVTPQPSWREAHRRALQMLAKMGGALVERTNIANMLTTKPVSKSKWSPIAIRLRENGGDDVIQDLDNDVAERVKIHMSGQERWYKRIEKELPELEMLAVEDRALNRSEIMNSAAAIIGGCWRVEGQEIAAKTLKRLTNDELEDDWNVYWRAAYNAVWDAKKALAKIKEGEKDMDMVLGAGDVQHPWEVCEDEDYLMKVYKV